MFLHLGGDILINQDKIIAILDLETATQETNKKDFIKNIKKGNEIKYVAEPGKEKSLIITTDGHYFSPISSMTLLRRSLFLDEQED